VTAVLQRVTMNLLLRLSVALDRRMEYNS